jgi:hypothetical protein
MSTNYEDPQLVIYFYILIVRSGYPSQHINTHSQFM